MADLLTDQRAAIDERLKELKPLHDEYLKLERARSALQGLEAPRRGPGRPRGSGSSGGGGGRRRRRGGTAAQKALEAVRQNPGITVNELAERLDVKQKNYLYRVLNGLRADGAVEKQGRGFVATGTTPEAESGA